MKHLLLVCLTLPLLVLGETVEENVKRAAKDIKKDLQRIETNVRRNLGDKSVSKKSKTEDSTGSEPKAKDKK